jgi:periplasmic divalent cation tolerance protein
MKKEDFIIVYTTTGSEEDAEKIAETLVSERLAACVQYTRIKSVYTWKGKVNKDDEFLIAVKTKRKLYKAVEKRIKELHPYECPEIIAVPIVSGGRDYLAWVSENTKE